MPVEPRAHEFIRLSRACKFVHANELSCTLLLHNVLDKGPETAL